jgi:hypothetical protein
MFSPRAGKGRGGERCFAGERDGETLFRVLIFTNHETQITYPVCIQEVFSMAEIELPNPEELEEAKHKSFTRRVALTTAIFAVLLAITSLGGNNAMKEMLLAGQQASDQWAYYQAKVIREHLYKNNRMRLEVDLLERQGTLKPEVKQRFEEMIKKLDEEEARFRTEKKEIEEKAREHEREREVNRAKDPYFDYAEVLLQISIVMASIAILSGSKAVFGFAATSAACGTLLMINGFLLLFRLPFLH